MSRSAEVLPWGAWPFLASHRLSASHQDTCKHLQMARPPHPGPLPRAGGEGEDGGGREWKSLYSAARLMTGSTRFRSSREIWQAMRWPVEVRRSGGGVVSQISPTLRGQRVAKGQPAGI